MFARITQQRIWKLAIRLGLIGALLLPLLLAGSVAADPDGVPTVMNYQGELRDADGNPVTGSYEMTFTIYDADTDGNVLWTETQTVQVTDGLLSVMLGSVEPLDPGLFDGSNRWLGVAVGSDPEMRPRLQLGTVPYVFHDETGLGTHDHWGETWTGAGTGLTLNSTGGGDGIYAAGNSRGGYFTSTSDSGTGVYGSGATNGGYFQNGEDGGSLVTIPWPSSTREQNLTNLTTHVTKL